MGGRNRAKYERDRQRAVERLCKCLGSNKLVAEVNRTDARAYVAIQRDIHAAETINKDIAWFKAMFSLAYDEMDIVRRNPWERLLPLAPAAQNVVARACGGAHVPVMFSHVEPLEA
jgi:hypothetical protein